MSSGPHAASLETVSFNYPDGAVHIAKNGIRVPLTKRPVL